MKLDALTPMLWVNDVKTTVAYYVNTLEFEEVNYVEEWGWAVLERDKVQIMIAKFNKHTPYKESRFTGSLYLQTDDVDAWWNLLKEKATVFYNIETFEWGMREFAIKDCNGYILQFGQETGGSGLP